MNADSPKVKSLFDRALEVPKSARSEFIKNECIGDMSLRRSVLDLVSAFDAANSFLETPAASNSARPVTENVGDNIGNYMLTELLGEGGFGRVYVAEQIAPVKRRVAVKAIKPGMDTREVLARFAAEEQALAFMDHPNIAKIFDAGMLPSGRPFFAMELVRGVPLTKYCDAVRLNVKQRLALFYKICQAVLHAHQKGIIHRDLKPGNILVTEIDGEPTPKIIDFGIAKAINQRLTQYQMNTRFTQLVGTPTYMSPEQAGFEGGEIDTRSDIYSLGVILYELLTGSTPIARQRLADAASEKIQEIIREDTPALPSQKISTSESLSSIAMLRSTLPLRLSRTVRGELDWVVMKALEKSKDRRYQTIGELADDLKRYQNQNAVLAGPPSRIYQLRRFVRKHTAVCLTTALVAGILVVSTGFSLRQTAIANAAQKQSESTTDLLLSSFKKPSPQIDGKDVRMVDVLSQASEKIKNSRELDPVSKIKLLETLQQSFMDLALYDDAFNVGECLIELKSETYGMHDGRTIQQLFSQISVAVLTKDFKYGLQISDKIRPLLEDHVPKDDSLHVAHMIGRASLLDIVGRGTEANELMGQAVALLEEHNELEASQYGNAAIAYLQMGKMGKGLELREKQYDEYLKAYGVDHPESIECANDLANAYFLNGDVQRQKEILEDAATRSERILGISHETTRYILSKLSRAILLDDPDRSFGISRRIINAEEVLFGKNSVAALARRARLGINLSLMTRSEGCEILDELSRTALLLHGPDSKESLGAEMNLQFSKLVLLCGSFSPSDIDPTQFAELDAKSADLFGRCKSILGERHNITRQVLCNWAMAAIRAKSAGKLIPKLQSAADINGYGKTQIMQTLSYALIQDSKFDKAIEVYRKILNQQRANAASADRLVLPDFFAFGRHLVEARQHQRLVEFAEELKLSENYAYDLGVEYFLAYSNSQLALDSCETQQLAESADEIRKVLGALNINKPVAARNEVMARRRKQLTDALIKVYDQLGEDEHAKEWRAKMQDSKKSRMKISPSLEKDDA